MRILFQIHYETRYFVDLKKISEKKKIYTYIIEKKNIYLKN